ncbi:hypothetical protein ROS217_07020 [Roseovarius sp. 217]|nr:hypothetical protein ROS217_07020 [Roseovarius sp. 217]
MFINPANPRAAHPTQRRTKATSRRIAYENRGVDFSDKDW